MNFRPLLRAWSCFLSVLLLLSCAHAASRKAPANALEATSGSAAQALPASENEGVWVLRPDGSVSCGGVKAQSLDEAKAELERAGISILDQWHGSDGRLHVMVCGAPSGQVNAFLIRRADLAKATAVPLKYAEASPDQLRSITKSRAEH